MTFSPPQQLPILKTPSHFRPVLRAEKLPGRDYITSEQDLAIRDL
jgi:hypothetical protein